MRRTLFYARRTVAALLVIVGLWFAASFVYVVWTEPLGGGALILLLALLGGFLFLVWMVFKIFGGIIRFVAGPPRRDERVQGLGADYEQMVTASPHGRRWRR
jgi:hypothetical protein